jgi:DNA-binding transcriptional ArsR family regulator
VAVTGDDDAVLPPGEAFAALGHEIRVGILEALAGATRVERPLAFSTLRERVGDVDSAQFNYHLGKLVGHFVWRRGDGYDLTPAGERVAEAVLSGAVTGDAELELTTVEDACPFCGARLAVSYRAERVVAFCPDCEGAYDRESGRVEKQAPEEYGFLGYLDLPPAGLAGRAPTAAHAAALRWHVSEQLLAGTGTCPRCSAPMAEWLELCENHDAAGGTCGRCENRYAAHHAARCENCVYARRATFGSFLLATTELQSFLASHGVNLAAPAYDEFAAVVMDYEEEVHRADPFEASFTFTAGGDALRVTVDDDFEVVAAVERDAT